RPRTARIQPLDDDHEARSEIRAAKRRLIAVDLLQLLDEETLVVARTHEPLPEEAALKYSLSKFKILRGDVLHPPSERQGGSDDCTGGRAGDQIKVVAEPEFRGASM